MDGYLCLLRCNIELNSPALLLLFNINKYCYAGLVSSTQYKGLKSEKTVLIQGNFVHQFVVVTRDPIG